LIIDKTVAIAILARDCEKTLPNNIKKIEHLRTYFKDSTVIVIENDSIDQTKNVLKEWERNARHVVVISEDCHTKTIPDKSKECPFPGTSMYRMEKMCFFRNKYMDYLRNINIEYDYLMIIDIDIDSFDVQSIIDTIINAPSDWTTLFANGVRYLKIFKKIKIGYYDTYPLLLCNENADDNIIIEKTYKEMAENAVKIIKVLKKKKFVSCVSAFGGIGIYKYPYIKNEHYYTIYNTRSSVFEVLCDHVSLNYTLYKKNVGTNYIASGMIVYYEQIKSVKLFFSLIIPLRIKKLLKKYPV
jgi:hypothetical protein